MRDLYDDDIDEILELYSGDGSDGEKRRGLIFLWNPPGSDPIPLFAMLGGRDCGCPTMVASLSYVAFDPRVTQAVFDNGIPRRIGDVHDQLLAASPAERREILGKFADVQRYADELGREQPA